MTRLELEQWLCGDRTRLPTAAEIARLLGLAPYTARGAALADVVRRVARGWFAVVVLRDVFGDDRDVCRWLRAPRVELGARCALDLLWAGETRAVEELAIREWHRPQASVDGWPLALLETARETAREAPRVRRQA